MKYFLIFVAFLIFSITAVHAQDGFYQLTFEAAGGYATTTVESTDNARKYFIRTNGSDISASFNNVQGNWYFALQDKDNAPTPVADPAFLNINNIDISGKTGLVFGVFLAVDNYLGSNSWTTGTDYVHIYYDIDGGGFNNMIWVEPRFSGSEPFIYIDFDGTGSSVDGQITDTFTEYRFNIPTTGSSLNIRFEFAGLTSIAADFAIDQIRVGSDATPLPVELTSFTAKIVDDIVSLYWETATEVNNYGFEIERARKFQDRGDNVGNDLKGYKTLGFVQGHGNSNSPKEYTFVDRAPLAGIIQYRLKQIDTDGSFEYSDIVEVETLPQKYELGQNYPNPFNPSTKIWFSIPERGDVKLIIYNTLGKLATELLNKEMEAGVYEQTWNASKYSSGVYIYMLSVNGNRFVKKMMLLR